MRKSEQLCMNHHKQVEDHYRIQNVTSTLTKEHTIALIYKVMFERRSSLNTIEDKVNPL